MSKADVTFFVQNWSDQPVVDKTSLTDLYNIQTDGWAPDAAKTAEPGLDNLPQGGDAGLADPDRFKLWRTYSGNSRTQDGITACCR